jgi:2-polyprenyl-3-methyl-5-hydroxy-6-metoxy-1,4-benzoquinol methylase
MAQNSYDEVIKTHYDKEASNHRDSKYSTMADEIIRSKETEVIQGAVASYCHAKCSKHEINIENPVSQGPRNTPFSIMEVGCGNGYMMKQLYDDTSFEAVYLGVEMNDALRKISEDRFLNISNVSIVPGDIRESNFVEGKFEILICQRVLINLLNLEDQKLALKNLLDKVNDGGLLVFCETFSSGLERLNIAREEFALDPIEAPYHNLCLPDDFFEHDKLTSYKNLDFQYENILSAHYYVSRVLYPAFAKALDVPFKRNSEFVKFMSSALVGTEEVYSPLQFRIFNKISPEFN